MGYLPHFSTMPMDEIIDLRRDIKQPLKRFRAAVGRIGRDSETRPIDESFAVEVEDAWRLDVEPALAEVRESLAEHGLLREVASVALGDPRRLLLEAGGVVAAAYGPVLSLSGALTAGAAVGIPTVDVAGRALQQHREERLKAKSSAFYFLHRVAEAADRHQQQTKGPADERPQRRPIWPLLE